MSAILQQFMVQIWNTLVSVSVTLDKVDFAVKNFFGSGMYWIWIFAALLSLFMLWAIIYCLVGSRYLEQRIENYIDLLGIGNLTRRRSLRGWKQILKRLQTNDQVQWKLAVLECDRILDDIIKASGFRGLTVHDRFKQITPDVLPNIEEIREAHKIRDRVTREPDFQLTRDLAAGIVAIYKKSFLELHLLDE